VAQPRHKRLVEKPRGILKHRHFKHLAVAGAALAMVGTSALAATLPDLGDEKVSAVQTQMTGAPLSEEAALDIRDQAVSRSERRLPLVPEKAEPKPKPAPKPSPPPAPEPPPEVVDRLFVTTLLNVWTGPGEDTTYLTALEAGTKVGVTGNTEGIWAEIVREGESRWVKAAYLAEEMPAPEPEPEPEPEPTEEATEEVSGISDAPCPSGSSVEDGLTPDAIRVHRAVCAAFPEVDSYGGLRSDGEHGEGRALDIMISGSTGDQIADYVRENSSRLGVSEVLWSQQIWTVQRSSEGWRPMEDRGSDTANHYDHVHVTVYGDSGG
jgi:hypothetical protein